MKTQPVHSDSIEGLKWTWNQVMHSLVQQIMRDWVSEQNDTITQSVQRNSPKSMDCKVQTQNPVA